MASAVPLFNGLKHLPCPKEAGGATCSTPGCLFGHRSDNKSPAPQRPSSQSLDGSADQDGLDAGEGAGPPKKRQRTMAGGSDELDLATSEDRKVTDNDDILNQSLAENVNTSDLYDPLSHPTVSDAMPFEPAEALKSSTTPTPAAPAHLAPSQPPSHSDLAHPIKSNASVSGSPLLKTSNSQTAAASTPFTIGKPLPASSSVLPSAKSSSANSTASPQPKAQSLVQDKASGLERSRKPEALNPRLLKSAPAAHSQRHQLLTMLHKELIRLNGEIKVRSDKQPDLKPLVKVPQELIWMALDMEEKVAKEKGPVYRNVMGHLVMSYKRMNVDSRIAELRKQDLEKEPVQKTSSSEAPVVIKTGLTPSQEIELLDKLVTPITDLGQYGYVSAPIPAQQIAEVKQTVEWSGGWEQCAQCAARFQVFPGRHPETGLLATGGSCTHHPGKSYYPERQPGHTGLVTKKYRCCTQDVGESSGCYTSESGHVWKTSDPKRLALLWNFMETPPNQSPDVKKAVAFDCEMGYTVHGMELIRLTATSWPDGAELIDILVQPIGEVLDLNSRYSGVFPSDLADALPWDKNAQALPQQVDKRKVLRKVPSPQAARDLLFSIISPETILIGHGLENDLNAMRIVHPRIIDTILLYPHKRGLPVRMSLKALMELHLRRKIQINTESGHDSAEDARAAGDLVRFRLQKKWNSMLSEGWRFLDGALRKPGWKRELSPAPEGLSNSEDPLDMKKADAMLTEEFLESSGS
ncbi:RNA exonuclease 3 [Gnomoniopsis smithogilvyi]|uniref:RNA exonuclease 3 n=1 Tax=Gnomoniopsis smithogilvyi TaxID=1191159 RepID=A0A9W8Z1I2_9PEZI|nr:RNA exonuclease 3 [Gnomoniopsis smithogilvyi]